MLTVKDVGVRYGGETVLEGISFRLRPGDWLMVIGPNGAGKSTLVNAITGGVPCTGAVRFDGEDVLAMKAARRARRLGVLMQNNHPGYAFSVEEVVRLGRYPWREGIFAGAGEDDEERVAQALKDVKLLALARRNVLTLSGGELQRVFLAQLLAQDPQVMILDEPANHLDLVYQKQVFGLIGEWIQRTGRAAISVVHDLSLARAYGSHGMLLNKGRCECYGEIGAVMDRACLEKVYEMDVYRWMQDMLGQWT